MLSLGIFSVVPPTEPCALRSTKPLKVSTRDFSWGKGGRCVWLTTYHTCSAETSRKSGALIYPELLGPPRPVAGDLYSYFTSNNTGTLVRRNIPRWMSLLSDVFVMFMSSIVVLTENVQFFYCATIAFSDLASNGKVVISWQHTSSTSQEILRIWNPKTD